MFASQYARWSQLSRAVAARDAWPRMQTQLLQNIRFWQWLEQFKEHSATLQVTIQDTFKSKFCGEIWVASNFHELTFVNEDHKASVASPTVPPYSKQNARKSEMWSFKTTRDQPMLIACFPLLSCPLMSLSMAEPMVWVPCWNGSYWASALLRNRFTFSRLGSKPGHIDEALWTICFFPYLLSQASLASVHKGILSSCISYGRKALAIIMSTSMTICKGSCVRRTIIYYWSGVRRTIL